MARNTLLVQMWKPADEVVKDQLRVASKILALVADGVPLREQKGLMGILDYDIDDTVTELVAQAREWEQLLMTARIFSGKLEL